MSDLEWKTRKERINARLRDMGPPWKIMQFRERLDTCALDHTTVTEYPASNGSVDDALIVAAGRFLLTRIQNSRMGIKTSRIKDPN